MEFNRIQTRSACLWLLAAWLMLAGAGRAWAELGGDLTSVDSDQRQMAGSKRAMRTAQRYTTHEFQAQSGTLVREYVSPGGKVFGVTWQGARIPDLQQLLGAYYAEFDRVAAEAHTMRRRGPLAVVEPGLVVESGGHMRAYVGRAYDPRLLPEGVPAGEIR